MNICVYGASSNRLPSLYTEAGEQLGRRLAERGHALIFGGGGSGMMGAVARGVKSGGGKIVGISPRFFNVDGILYDGCDELLFTETMSERKMLMAAKADGFIVTPGGLGTLDEIFEMLTLKQLGLHQKPIAFFNVNGYFDPLLPMLDRAIEDAVMKESNRLLFCGSKDADAVLDLLEHPTPYYKVDGPDKYLPQ